MPVNSTDNLPDYPVDPGHVIVARMLWRDKYLRTFGCNHYYAIKAGGVPNAVGLLEGANTLFTNLMGEVDDLQDHETFGVGVSLRFINNEGTDIYCQSNEDPIAGSKGTLLEDATEEIESSPPQVALIIRKITTKAGRQNRGRMFIPFISEQVIHDGVVDGLNEVTVKDVMAVLKADLTCGAVTITPKHWNRKENKLVDLANLACVDVTGTRRDRRYKGVPRLIMPAA